MHTFERDAEPLRVEAYMREDAHGTAKPQQAVLDRLRDLEAQGVLEMSGCESWQSIRTREYETDDDALSTYEEFREWARHNDVRLEPAFQERIRSRLDRTEVNRVVVFPVTSLAVYCEDDLRAVFPCSRGDEHVTVQDCLRAFEAGQVDRFLAQFRPESVDRVSPRMEPTRT